MRLPLGRARLATSTVIKAEISGEERDRILIEELGISEEAVNAIPPDE